LDQSLAKRLTPSALGYELPRRQHVYWTRAKLGVLKDYLDAFIVASSRQPERIYLDAFAGQGIGQDRLTGEEFPGSARIASQPPSGRWPVPSGAAPGRTYGGFS
jgi:hypothetical protein